MTQFLQRFVTKGFSKYNLTRSLSCRSKIAPQYRVRIAYPRDYEKIMNLMVDTFFKKEPSIVNIGGFSIHDNPDLIQLMYRNVREGMTLVAENRYTDCVVAAAINITTRKVDIARTEMTAKCCSGLSPQGRELLKFFAFCSKQANIWDTYCVDNIFECAYLSVHPEHQKQGLAKRLVQDSWVLARDTAYRLFRIDCTSRFTARIAEEFGWECVYTMPYGRYFSDGEFIFKCITEPHREIKIFVDGLNYYKGYYPPVRKSRK